MKITCWMTTAWLSYAYIYICIYVSMYIYINVKFIMTNPWRVQCPDLVGLKITDNWWRGNYQR